MKDEFDVLFSNKDSDIEHIADRYKAASEKDKEKIYEISKRKYNILKSEESESASDDYVKEAEGVEHYSRPVWYRWVYASAASVMLVGAISGGLILARNHKKIIPSNQNPTTEVSTQVTTAEIRKNTDPNDMDGVMDELLSSWVKIQNAQFGRDAAENEELKYELSSDAIAPEEYVYSYFYHKVTEDGAETFADLDKMLASTYSEYVYEHLIGGDMSQYESGTRFGEETDEGRALRHFIKYGNSAYARWRPDYQFSDMCDFENYDLVSSEFKDSADEFDYKSSAFCEWYSGKVYALKFTSAEFYEAFEEKGEDFVGIFDSEYDDVALCQRVYKAKDGDAIVNADFLLVKQADSWKIANFALNGNGFESQITTEETTVETTEAANTVETSSVQLHDPVIYKSRDEAMKGAAEIEEKFRSGQFKFEKIDAEKYVNNMVNATEIDNLENKCFIYHMLWNSYHYFDTAEVEYATDDKMNCDLHTDFKVSVNNRENYMRYESENSNGISNCYYQDGKTYYEVYKEDRAYYTNELEESYIEQYGYFVPDNLRIVYIEDENGVSIYKCFDNNVFGHYSSECLYNGGAVLNDFNSWHIETVDQYLGRVSAVVKLVEKGGEYTYYTIDLKTGIILRRADFLENGEEERRMEVKSIKLNEPIEKKMFDLTAYTDMKEQ